MSGLRQPSPPSAGEAQTQAPEDPSIAGTFPVPPGWVGGKGVPVASPLGSCPREEQVLDTSTERPSMAALAGGLQALGEVQAPTRIHYWPGPHSLLGCVYIW